MGYKISYDEIYMFYQSFMDNGISKACTLRENLPKGVQTIIESDYISGATATRMRNYMRDVHLTILSLFSQTFQLFTMELLNYQQDYLNIVDSAPNACFSSDEFKQTRDAVESLKKKTSSIDGNIRETLRYAGTAGYSPAEVGGYPGVDGILADLGTIANFIANIDETVSALENAWAQKVADNFDGLLDVLEGYIRDNLGHNSMYMSSYSEGNRGIGYNKVNEYDHALESYISANKDSSRMSVAEVNQREYERRSEELTDKLAEQNQKSALTVRVFGYVGDVCFTTAEVALIAFGLPKSAVQIVTGTAKGSWDGWYRCISDEIEGYQLGTGAIADADEVQEKVFIGAVKGTMHGVISVGMDGLSEEVIGRIPLVNSLTDSENAVTKYLSKLTIKTVENRIEDISGNAVDQFVDTAAQQYREGSAYTGASPIEAARNSIQADLEDNAAWGRSAAESMVSMAFSSNRKNTEGEIKTTEDLLKTHGSERWLKAGSSKALETVTKELTGTAVEGFIQAGDGREVQDGIDAVVDQFTDEKKVEGLLQKTALSFTSGATTDYYRQKDEAERILTNNVLKSKEIATQALERKNSVPVDKYGNPDYAKTSAIYKDQETGEKASVTIRVYGNDDYDSLVDRAEQAYSVKIEQDGFSLAADRFETPSGYRWVSKYDQSCDQQSVTLQLVRADKLPD